MDVRQLRYFLAIAEEGNISKAAERQHIAQPPLSRQLKLLEEELGVTLAERSTRKIQITDAGRILQHRAKQILELMDTTVQELKDFNEGLLGTLSIGAIASCVDTLLPARILGFHQKYPGINFQIRECSTDEILELIKSGVIEIGIIRSPFNLGQYESICLPEEPMVAAVSNASYWDRHGQHMQLDELANKPLLVHRRYERMILDACQQAGFEPRILCKIDDTKSILTWAHTGMGIAIIPKDWIDLAPGMTLEYREIDELSLKTRTAIIWLKNRRLSSAARHFVEIFEAELKA
jgi:DNA-binding transcriptional LysR family regulator